MARLFASLAPASGLASAAFRLVVDLFKAIGHRREVLNLAEFDDRALKDIGLSRGDVDGALAEPFHRDPTLVLVRAHEHRARVQAVAGASPKRPLVPMKAVPSRC